MEDRLRSNVCDIVCSQMRSIEISTHLVPRRHIADQLMMPDANIFGVKPKSEVRSQKSEVRSQKSEVRSQKSEVRSSNEFESCVVYSVQSYPLCVVKGGLKGVTYSILYKKRKT